ncbi:MAG: putative metal-binding motif-containing protein, partial [Candidatus Woesearchaeota archaeon]
DSIDNDCDGDVDEGLKTTYYADSDGDEYGDSSNSTESCSAPPGYVENDNDCNDNKAGIHPGARDICGNGIDEDCFEGDKPCPTDDDDDNTGGGGGGGSASPVVMNEPEEEQPEQEEQEQNEEQEQEEETEENTEETGMEEATGRAAGEQGNRITGAAVGADEGMDNLAGKVIGMLLWAGALGIFAFMLTVHLKR